MIVPWVKVEQSYLRHPKVARLSPEAKLLHLASILWTAEHLQDGYVPATALRQLCDDVPIASRWRRHYAVALVSAGLWDEVEDGWIVHDFDEHNHSSTRAVVEQERAATRERVRRYRKRRGDGGNAVTSSM